MQCHPLPYLLRSAHHKGQEMQREAESASSVEQPSKTPPILLSSMLLARSTTQDPAPTTGLLDIFILF